MIFVEFTLTVLGIAKKEFHDMVIDLVKRKWLSTKQANMKSINISIVLSR